MKQLHPQPTKRRRRLHWSPRADMVSVIRPADLVGIGPQRHRIDNQEYNA
ncbi:hypothetical protein [Ktedonosporobacter rubrisoli]|nr:hypothetical protein [Ktedonosporobacter rubrisoli]